MNWFCFILFSGHAGRKETENFPARGLQEDWTALCFEVSPKPMEDIYMFKYYQLFNVQKSFVRRSAVRIAQIVDSIISMK